MTDSIRPQFRDLVPWADPYIVSLVKKLLDANAESTLWAELPPPLGSDGAVTQQPQGRHDWLYRGPGPQNN